MRDEAYAASLVIRPLVPAYCSAADGPWLQALLDERARFAGQRRAVWRARSLQPLPVRAPPKKLRVALDVLDRATSDRCAGPAPARRVRALLFRAAADQARDAAIEWVASQLQLSSDAVLEALFADLPDERVLPEVPQTMSATELALACNELMVQRCLQLAVRARIAVDGDVRAVVRHAKWTGLLCVVRSGATEERAVLEVSGPYALFRHTRLYGRALSSLLSRLAHCRSFRFEADCVLRGGDELARLTLRSGDPISPARELARYDSRVEERFARDFGKLAIEWDVVREPRPIVVGASLFFPDFQLRRRTTGECYWVEIVGFWTEEYLAKKLAQLEAAQLDRMILCVDEARRTSSARLQGLAPVVWYTRRIDARRVIELVDPALAHALPTKAQGARGLARRRPKKASSRS